MPNISFDQDQLELWTDSLLTSYEQEVRTGTHVSDLILCLRQGPLLEEYLPDWNIETLYRFTLGRALEKAVFQLLLPAEVATQELEVKQDGIEGHIDFGADPYDFECKLTWSHPPRDIDELLSSKFWWFEQAGAYAFMRRRTECEFVVLYLASVPQLHTYRVEWAKEELEANWAMLLSRKKYREEKKAAGLLPMRTTHKWLCQGCSVKGVCWK